MKKTIKRLLPILLGILIIVSIVWYLFVYDQAFTHDMLLKYARYFEERGNHTTASWLYNRAYVQSGGDDEVAIELAEQFKSVGNYTKAEVTLSNAIAEGGSSELYIALCKTYVEQDKLMDAVSMLEHITDESIKQELEALRPAAPTVSPEPNYYNQYINVTVSCDSGTLFVTTNREYPSIEDTPSDGNLTLVNGENTIYALSVGENGLVSPLSIFGFTVSGVVEEILFSDSTIEALVRQELGLMETDPIYSNDLWTITSLTIPAGAESYTDLGHLPYLQQLTISGSSADSLDGLVTLNCLTELTITDSQVRSSDLATIASLPNLQKLILSGCGLSGMDNLDGARNLTYLDLSDNSIQDVTGLSFMSNLTYLDLSHNALTTLNAISSLEALQTLDVSYNSLSSVAPIAGCTQLVTLNINNNAIESLTGIAALSSLQSLNASYNNLTDVTAASTCTALQTLDISSNALTDISCLSSLTALQHFYFSRNEVSALPDFGKSSVLEVIDGSYNQIITLGSLSDYEHLNYVLMDYNQISSVAPLANCYNLIKVSVFGNPVTDVSTLTEHSIIVNYNPIG